MSYIIILDKYNLDNCACANCYLPPLKQERFRIVQNRLENYLNSCWNAEPNLRIKRDQKVRAGNSSKTAPNMNQKNILTLLCAISLVQGIKTDTSADGALTDLNSKLAFAKTKVDNVIQHGGNLIRQTRRIISQTIIEARTSLPPSASLSDAQIKKLEGCSKIRDLDLLVLQFDFLRVAKSRLSNSVRFCSIANNNQKADVVDSCVEAEIAKLEKNIEEIRDRFNVVCEEATKKVTVCTEEVVKSLDKIVAVPRF